MADRGTRSRCLLVGEGRKRTAARAAQLTVTSAIGRTTALAALLAEREAAVVLMVRSFAALTAGGRVQVMRMAECRIVDVKR